MINFNNDLIPDLDNFLQLYYHKILKVNLTQDTYQVIQMLNFEHAPTTSLSNWLNDFAEQSVAPEDKDKFKEHTNLDYLRSCIGEKPLNFTYKRKFPHDRYAVSEMIILPSVNYTDDNQVCFIFVKDYDLLD